MFERLICILSLAIILLVSACSSNDPISSPNNRIGNHIPDEDDDDAPPPEDPNEVKTRWDVPGGGGEIIRGCLGFDCIPSLQDPQLISLEAATYLNEDDLVLGLVVGNEVRAYPHRILDWHEIINQYLGSNQIAVTYCPLTGSGVAIDVSRTAGDDRGFGVSGFLYNNNLIPYDRVTFSNWSQMYLRCVNGILRGRLMVTVPLIETTWKTWKKMFPNSKVVSNITGFDRPYDIFPYGNYKTDPFLLFPITRNDARLPERKGCMV